MNRIKEKIKQLIGRTTQADLMPDVTRSDDVYLVSYPRSGVTYLSFLIANCIIGFLKLSMEVNFFNLHMFVPDLHVTRDIPPELPFPPFRRIMKSHAPYQEKYKRILLLVRDPRDVLTSYYHFSSQRGRFSGSLSEFIRDPKLGLPAWLHHTLSWVDNGSSQDLQIIRYEDIRRNPVVELKKIFGLMGFTLSDDACRHAIENSSLENMKKSEEATYSYTIKGQRPVNFVRQGRVQGEKNLELTADDQSYIIATAGVAMAKLGYS